MALEYRAFVQYPGIVDKNHDRWTTWCNENVGLIEHDWWVQDVTDYWENNTACWYFRDQETADAFEFYVRLAK